MMGSVLAAFKSGSGTTATTGSAATYTAPSTAGTHTISVTDGTTTASGTITVQAPVAPPPVVPPVVTVGLTPATSSLSAGGSATFTATVSGSTNTAVAWTVDGVAGGNATTGTLSGTGNTVVYSAPASAGTHTLVATSAASSSSSASASISVAAPVVNVTLNPSGSLSLNTSATQTFTATVTGASNTGVTWTVDGIAGGNTTVGSLSGSGNSVVYTAPASTGTHTVTARSAQNTSVSASTSVTVQSSSAIQVALTDIGSTFIKTSGATLFTAKVTGSTNTAVTWAVDGITGGNATVGTIAAPVPGNTVIYNAPAATGTHTIQAISAADSTKHASVTLNVAPTVVQLSAIAVGANVKDSPYNAKGDGVTDDTAAINAAVQAVAGTGKAVVIPAGTYMINAQANSGAGIRLGSNMTLSLQPGAILQAKYTSTMNYQVVAVDGVSNVNICGGSIRGNNGNNGIPTPTTDEDGNAIRISKSSNIVVEGVATSNCFCDGIYICSQSDNITVSMVDSQSNRRNGMSVVWATRILVSNSNFSNNTGSVEVAGQGILNGSGIDLEANANQSLSTVLVTKSTFYNNYWAGLCWGIGYGTAPGSSTDTIFVDGNISNGNDRGLDVEMTTASAITNNTTLNNHGVGIYIHDGAVNTLCQGNVVSGTGSAEDYAGIECYNDTGTLVNHNSSTSNSRYGVFIAYSTNATVTNNTCTGNGSAGVYVTGSTGTTLTGNAQ
jgi:parallel beta-helix repeat protein